MIYPVPSGTFASSTSSEERDRLAALRGRSRRSVGFLLSGVFICTAAAAAGKHRAADPVPVEPSILEIQQGLAAERFDVPALERHYEGRIHSIDRAGPHLNSIIELNPDAAQIATALQAGTDHTQPLFGVPVLIKGVLAPKLAAQAVQHGVAGIFVSNHGGRPLDGVPASFTVLKAGRVPCWRCRRYIPSP